MITDPSLFVLSSLLIFLLFCSAFFSGSETAITLASRSKIQVLANENHRGAKRVLRLMDNLEKTLSTILLGNNFVNILASALTTVITLELVGESGLLVATIFLTAIVLIFAEITPKTFSTKEPERIAIIVSFILEPLSNIIAPINKIIGFCVNLILRLANLNTSISPKKFTVAEIRAIFTQNQTHLSVSHHRLLSRVFTAEEKRVKEIMIPRTKIQALDLSESFENIKQQIQHSVYNHLPAYDGDLSHLVGEIPVMDLWKNPPKNIDDIKSVMQEVYYVPENICLLDQLNNFKQKRRSSGLVVDEHGDIIGFINLKLILDYLMDIDIDQRKIRKESKNIYVVDANCSMRELALDLGIPSTVSNSINLNGMLVDYLGYIPTSRLSIKIDHIFYEVIKTTSTGISLVKIDLNTYKAQRKALKKSKI